MVVLVVNYDEPHGVSSLTGCPPQPADAPHRRRQLHGAPGGCRWTMGKTMQKPLGNGAKTMEKPWENPWVYGFQRKHDGVFKGCVNPRDLRFWTFWTLQQFWSIGIWVMWKYDMIWVTIGFLPTKMIVNLLFMVLVRKQSSCKKWEPNHQWRYHSDTLR